METEKRNLNKVKLYVAAYTLLPFGTFLLYARLAQKPLDVVLPIILAFGAAVIIWSFAAFFLIKWLKLDLYFKVSNVVFKNVSLAILTLLALVFFFIFNSYSESGQMADDFPETSDTQLSGIKQVAAAGALSVGLFSWYAIVSLTTLLIDYFKKLYKVTSNKLPEVQKYAKDQYDQSSLPLKKKLTREKLLAELADLGEVEPEKRAFTKADYQSKKKDIDEIADLERELKIKKLEKELRELKDDSPPS
ncbi:hypothetical protein F7C95_05590 [Opitutia bacterium ISCC 51]|nr:hypothetical protein F7C95_05590 [Opitutae bacterium ISCC 51]QXD29439.1 hypothetical protein GA003_05565 [Opitutae bacterium ISCC 52]